MIGFLGWFIYKVLFSIAVTKSTIPRKFIEDRQWPSIILGPGGSSRRSSQKAKKATHAITTKFGSVSEWSGYCRPQNWHHAPGVDLTGEKVQWNEEWTTRQDVDKIQGTIWNFLIFISTKIIMMNYFSWVSTMRTNW